MYSARELFTVFIIGGLVYGLMEFLFRGYTHWSMLLTGGACLFVFYIINFRLPEGNILLRCFIATLIITSLELTVGYIVNIVLKWNVWDYSNMPFNIKGQICLRFSVLWLTFGLPMTMLSKSLRRFFR